ncbi:MAG: rhodanese-like domain-containing protein [Bacteroidales bacterium]
MTKTKVWMLSILFTSFLVVSCNKDDEEPVNESQVLIEYLESVDSPLGKYYVNSTMPAITSATDVHNLMAVNAVYIIDIRSSTDYANGHIEGAHNVAAGDVLSHVQGINTEDYDKVVIVCYSGQTAAWATSILQLMGYDNVYSMAFGMCSWNEHFANSWNSNTSNMYATQFVSEATAKGEAGDLPELTTGKETGQEILESQVANVLSEGFAAAKVSAAEVFGNLENYYIINYWPETDYTDPGHIPGAIQYTPKEAIALSADLKTIPADKTVVVYCYTGQTSANLTAYLRIIGYDAKSLLFGTNGMIYNEMEGHKWSTDAIMGYDYVSSN